MSRPEFLALTTHVNLRCCSPAICIASVVVGMVSGNNPREPVIIVIGVGCAIPL